MIRFARLPVSFPLDAMQQEAAAFSGNWHPHFNTYHYEGEWNVISLRSAGGRGETIIPENHNGDDYADTVLMASCPSVKAVVDSLRCEVMAVRFLNLRKGAVIRPHRDHELSYEKGEARLHFPVFTNGLVKFFVEEERVVMKEGECWYINANLTHAVSNEGASDRIHLVVDCKVNGWLQEVFERALTASTKEEDASEIEKVIAELRRHGKPESDRIADALEIKTTR